MEDLSLGSIGSMRALRAEDFRLFAIGGPNVSGFHMDTPTICHQEAMNLRVRKPGESTQPLHMF